MPLSDTRLVYAVAFNEMKFATYAFTAVQIQYTRHKYTGK